MPDITNIMPQIQHVVHLMLENRSLDNVLGWLYEGGNQPARIIHGSQNAQPPTYDGLGNGTRYYNKLGDTPYYVTRGASSMFAPIVDPNEEYAHVNVQLFEQEAEPAEGTAATMGGFMKDYYSPDNKIIITPQIAASQIMVTYTPEQLPILHGLARQYAVSDRWFSSVPTQTNPNRAFSICGTSMGAEKNETSQTFNHTTIWNVLEDNHRSDWAIYYHRNTLPYYLGDCYTHYTFAGLHDIPYVYEHECGIETFYRKAQEGTLPAFSYLEPSWVAISGGMGNDYHPPANLSPGEHFLSRVYQSLTSNAEAWSKTLLIVTFDEHGGTWDHVAPPWGAVPPDGATGETGFRFNRFGVRVPTLLVTPWVDAKTVFRSEKVNDDGREIPYDHTSVIATILKWMVPDIDLASCGLGKRVAIAPTFEGVLTRTQPRTDTPQHTVSEPHLDEATHRDAALNGFQTDIYLPVLANNLLGVDANDAAERQLVDDMRAQCTTQGDLDRYVKAYVAEHPREQPPQGYRVKIVVKNETRARIWYWLAWDHRDVPVDKVPVGNPLGNPVEAGDTIVAFEHVDSLDNQYYIAAAYWVGDNDRIPEPYRTSEKRQWRLLGAAYPGWMKIGRRQTLTIKQVPAASEPTHETDVQAALSIFNYAVNIQVRNDTPSEITYWLAWGTEAKTYITSLLGVSVQPGDTATAYQHDDTFDHQYYLAIAYWVGDDAKIPEDYRITTLPGWALYGAKSPGWIPVSHVQTYVVQQSGPPTAVISGPLGACD